MTVRRQPERCLIGVLSAALAIALAVGCRSKQRSRAVPAEKSSAVASASAVPERPAGRCRELAPGPAVRLGEPARAPSNGDDDDEAADDSTLPFAPEIGQAVALPGWFAASAQRSAGGGTEDVIALVPDDGKPGRIVSLGRVYGDVDPAVLAARGAKLGVGVLDSDAKGTTLKLFLLGVTSDAPRPLGELTDVEQDAGVAAAYGPRGPLFVLGRRRVGKPTSLASVQVNEGAPRPLGINELEGTQAAESPVLALRPGGYWLAYVVERGVPDAGAPADGDRLVAIGARTVLALLLDADGKPTGRPLAVSAPDAHATGFAAAAQPDGSLALAFREDDATPGVDRGDIELARVALDGSITRGRIDDEDIGTGLPSLFADEAAGHTWLGVHSARDAVRFGTLAPSALAVQGLATDPALGRSELVAAGAGRVLEARFRGGALELGVLACKP